MGFLSLLEEGPLALAEAEPIVPRARPAAPVADVLSHCRRVVDCAMKRNPRKLEPSRHSGGFGHPQDTRTVFPA